MDDNVLFKSKQPIPASTGIPPGQQASPNQQTEASNSNIETPKQEPTKSQISEFAKPPLSVPPTMPPPSGQVTIEHPKARSGKFWIKIAIGIVLVILVTLVVIFFLPKESSEKVKLTWWGLWEENQVVDRVIADFERTNPKIDIEYSKQDPKQYRERLITRIKNGTGPDIFRFHNTWYPMIFDIVLPLPSDVIAPSDFKKIFYPVMQKDLSRSGAIYGIPMGADTLSLFVNTEVLNAAGVSVPKNWDEFVKAAKTLTVKDENGKIKTSGASIGTYNNVTHAPDIVALLFAQQGVDLNKFSSSIDDKIDVLDFYTSFAKGDDATWNTTLDSSIISFSQGKVAMYFGYSWDIFTIQRLNKDLDFKIYPVPSLFNRNITIASYWVDGVSNKSPHPKEAFLFMKYLTQKDTVQKLYTESSKTRSFGTPYARVDLAETLKDNQLVYTFVSQLSQATSSFFASDTFDGEGGLNSAMNTYLGNTINSIVLDNSSPATEIDTLDKGVNQVLSKYAVQ